MAGSALQPLRQQAFPLPHQTHNPLLPLHGPQQSLPGLSTFPGLGFGLGAMRGGGAGLGLGDGGMGEGTGCLPSTTSRWNEARDGGILAGLATRLLPVPPVFLRVHAASPGHSFTNLQPQAAKYHRSCPSVPLLTPQSTFFQPCATLLAVELRADVTGFQSPVEVFPQIEPYCPSLILLVSSAEYQYCSKKLDPCDPCPPLPGPSQVACLNHRPLLKPGAKNQQVTRTFPCPASSRLTAYANRWPFLGTME